ncbi:MAG: exodeoxyribonuclease VII small subunit [Hespellia sp.]|nr:exodeoxyribonuclease VII small subunit [Hespellia sp.]
MAEQLNKKEDMSLEDIFQSLEGIVTQLESDQISLEDSFTLYNRGMNMLKECNDKIDTVEKKIKVLDEAGKEQDF